jgi:hypothetical protein
MENSVKLVLRETEHMIPEVAEHLKGSSSNLGINC